MASPTAASCASTVAAKACSCCWHWLKAAKASAWASRVGSCACSHWLAASCKPSTAACCWLIWASVLLICWVFLRYWLTKDWMFCNSSRSWFRRCLMPSGWLMSSASPALFRRLPKDSQAAFRPFICTKVARFLAAFFCATAMRLLSLAVLACMFFSFSCDPPRLAPNRPARVPGAGKGVLWPRTKGRACRAPNKPVPSTVCRPRLHGARPTPVPA